MTIENLSADYLLAAQQEDIDKVRICLVLGVGTNTYDHQGKAAITLVSLYQQYVCVQVLIDAGANINKQDHACLNPPLTSCLNDDLTLPRIILPAKPDLNYATCFGGVSLTPACEEGYLSIVKGLLAHTEINVNQTNHVDWTSLLEAIVLNGGGIKQQAIVQLLLEHGASLHLTDRHGKTPLELARGRSFEGIAQLLIAAGTQTGRLTINTPERRCMQALAVDADFLAQRGQEQVEQVFTRTVNIVPPVRQQLLMLLCEEYDNMPNSCRLALTHFNDLFRRDDKVQSDNQGITVGQHLHIEMNHCQRWLSPTLQMTALSFHLITQQQQHDTIHQHPGEDETLFSYRGDNPFCQTLDRELHIKRWTVIQAVNDKQNIAVAVASMIDLGTSLTSSTSDYLTSLVSILFLPGHPVEKYKEEFYLGL